MEIIKRIAFIIPLLFVSSQVFGLQEPDDFSSEDSLPLSCLFGGDSQKCLMELAEKESKEVETNGMLASAPTHDENISSASLMSRVGAELTIGRVLALAITGWFGYNYYATKSLKYALIASLPVAFMLMKPCKSGKPGPCMCGH